MEQQGVGKLLVLDDDAAIGITIAAIAESISVTTRTTARPDEFFALLEEWQPTHIALDLIMPEIDGIEVLRRLGDAGCTAGIIITSGVGSRVLDAARRSAEEHGLNILAALSKPFSAGELRSILQRPLPAGAARTGSDFAASRPAATTAMLREGLALRQISLVYQPKISCSTGQPVGFEALARWNHPVHGFISPGEFIPLAESSNLIDALTAQVFSEALRWLGSNHLRSNLTLSLNISALSLVDISFADRVAARCAEHGIDPRRIILELTETAAMSDASTTLDLLTRLRVKGFSLSIDDFGVGYSSLVQLARLPFSELKIDKMFVITAATSAESRKIIEAVVRLGHSLDLKVTAEGVEDDEALAHLKRTGCDYAQGYRIGRPMAQHQLEDWMRGHYKSIDLA